MEKSDIEKLLRGMEDIVKEQTVANKEFNANLHRQVNTTQELMRELFKHINDAYMVHITNLEKCRDTLADQNKKLIVQNTRLMNKVERYERETTRIRNEYTEYLKQLAQQRNNSINLH